MIIRISAEGQYSLDGLALAELNRMDDNLFDVVAAGDEEGFTQHFAQVLALVRVRGAKLPDTELVESDLILPAPDTTLADARSLFAGYPRDIVPPEE